MIDDKIKIKFGAAVIQALTEFARTGIPDPANMDAKWFEHIQDKTVREAVCDTFYGARWHYKIGLALLVEKKEQYAHVRAQVIDYASICETLLVEMIIHGVGKAKLSKQQYQFMDFQQTKPLNWKKAIRKTAEKQTFAWYIHVAQEEGIIDAQLATDLEGMRTLRNTVHITERAKKSNAYSLKVSDDAFKIMQRTINQTKSWFNKNK
ncbi:hypothetical protein [Aeromonas caviae]|uniref:hypothetical protein n=1 Tax=Aeromonas caviae TaxID=648 RepID=UPI0038D04D24